MPYISTSRPLPLVTLVNVPLRLLRYSAWSDFLPRGCQSRLLISSTSSQPSPSASNSATPAPNVSGRYFLPARPLLWVNLMPAAAVASVSFTPFGAGAGAAARVRTKAATRTAALTPLPLSPRGREGKKQRGFLSFSLLSLGERRAGEVRAGGHGGIEKSP